MSYVTAYIAIYHPITTQQPPRVMHTRQLIMPENVPQHQHDTLTLHARAILYDY